MTTHARQSDPALLRRVFRALPAAQLLVWLLAASLFMPPWMLPRAVTLLPLIPVQNPSEEESHSSHSAAAQLQQLSAISSGKRRRPTAVRSGAPSQPPLNMALARLACREAPLNSEVALRNGCGAPLRC